MAPLITFAFGPDETYVFDSPQSSCFHRLGWAFQTIRHNVSRYYSLSLGPGENDYAAFYVGHDRKLHYSMNYPYEPLLKAATEWLMDIWKKSPAGGVTRSRLAVAPRGLAYVAITPTAIRWGPDENLPDSLLAILKTCIVGGVVTVAEVSLGMAGSWWAKFHDGSCRWDLAGRYRELGDILGDGVVSADSIEFVAFSQHDPNHWFLLYERYKIRYSLPAHIATQVSAEIEVFQASLQTVSGVHESAGSRTAAAAATGGDEELPPSYSESSGVTGGTGK